MAMATLAIQNAWLDRHTVRVVRYAVADGKDVSKRVRATAKQMLKNRRPF